eukprot:m.1481068 g.1481068  ORF g.1481068 m.1481068 type:complete len:55 (+) comp25173_c2_seq3:2410-2574(+)
MGFSWPDCGTPTHVCISLSVFQSDRSCEHRMCSETSLCSRLGVLSLVCHGTMHT